MKAIGMPLFAAEDYGSPAITAVAPEGIDAEQLRKAVKEKFDILLAGGQDHLKGIDAHCAHSLCQTPLGLASNPAPGATAAEVH